MFNTSHNFTYITGVSQVPKDMEEFRAKYNGTAVNVGYAGATWSGIKYVFHPTQSVLYDWIMLNVTSSFSLYLCFCLSFYLSLYLSIDLSLTLSLSLSPSLPPCLSLPL